MFACEDFKELSKEPSGTEKKVTGGKKERGKKHFCHTNVKMQCNILWRAKLFLNQDLKWGCIMCPLLPLYQKMCFLNWFYSLGNSCEIPTLLRLLPTYLEHFCYHTHLVKFLVSHK